MKAWQEPDGVIRDVCHGDPAECYMPEVAALYSTDVPDGTLNGATLVGDEWVNPAPPPAPAPPPPAPPDAWGTLIDIGPFFDRFAAHKYPILMSADTQVQALVKDLQVRKWVDLARADVAQGLDLLVTKSLLDADGKAAALALPVEDDENFALRKAYFA